MLFARRANNNASWEEFTFDSTTLGANSLLGETLTLDLIDQHHGAFGWVALDTVTIGDAAVVPEPSTFSLLGLASLAGVFLHIRRRRK